MGICSVHSIVLYGDAILPAVFTSFGKLSMIVDYMVLQGIWHGKRFTTIFTFVFFEAFMNNFVMFSEIFSLRK